jgi:hypothetical protein
LWVAFPSRAADYDDAWCSGVSKPEHIVICADQELRDMAKARIYLLAYAKQHLSLEAYQLLRDDEGRWVKSYTAACGIASDGPAPSRPISQSVIECYKRAGRDQLANLNTKVHQQVPEYRPHTASPDEVAANQQAMRLAEEAWKKRITDKLESLGYTLITPTDLELDWRDLVANSKKIAIFGTYIEVDDIDFLRVENNRDQPNIILDSKNALRDARKAMLECRNSEGEQSCPMIIGATVKTCVEHKGQLNEREVPCLAVIDVFTD